MRILLLLLLILVSEMAEARKIRFTDTSNKWTLLYVSNSGWPYVETKVEINRFLRDTVIAGVNYRRLSTPELAVREDTVQGRLYFRFVSDNYYDVGGTDTFEHLLFDYNFKIGDSLRMDYGTHHFTHGVQAIDSVQLGSAYYKRWHMESRPGFQSYSFIEGLGTPKGTTWNVFPLNFEHGYQLRCFSNNGANPICVPPIPLPYGYLIPVYSGPQTALYFDNDSSCILQRAPIGVVHIVAGTNPILAPNPGGRESILRFPFAAGKAILSITDVTGRDVARDFFDGKTDIPIGQYLSTPGVYFYTLQDAATGRRYTGRFIFR